MSKRKKHRGKSTGVMTKPPADDMNVPTLLPRIGGDSSAKWRWFSFSALSVALLAGLGLYQASVYGLWPFNQSDKPLRGKLLGADWLSGERGRDTKPKGNGLFDEVAAKQGKLPPQEKWKIDAWRAVSEQDKVIDGFVLAHGKAEAVAMLADLPADDGPVSDEEYERRAANDFLRKKGVKITDVWRGETGADGKPRPAAKRYVLVTKGDGTTPHLRVRDKKGDVSPTSFGLHDPVIVVEVQGKKIQPLRTEINKRP